MDYEEQWYWCDIQDAGEEPDWSLVPDDRREMVRSRWLEAQSRLEPKRWKLWGPQIPMYIRLPGMKVTVTGGG